MMRKALFVALGLIISAPAQAEDNLYDRIAAKMTADPALASALGKPGPEMASVAWMLGTWDVVATVMGGHDARAPEHGTSVWSTVLNGTWIEMRDSYPAGVQDLGYFGYSPATKRWTSVSLDSAGNAAVTTGDGWVGAKFVFEGDVVVVGEAVHLRQTYTHDGTNAMLLTNEQRMSDGTWQLLDTYRYTRK